MSFGNTAEEALRNFERQHKKESGITVEAYDPSIKEKP